MLATSSSRACITRHGAVTWCRWRRVQLLRARISASACQGLPGRPAAAVAGQHGGTDLRTQALVTQAVRRFFHEHAVAADVEARTTAAGTTGGPRRNVPAVVAEGGAIHADAGHPFGAASSQRQRQYRAHRQASDEQLVDLATQARRCIFHALVPLFPGGRQQVIHGAAMAGQLHAVYGEAGVVQAPCAFPPGCRSGRGPAARPAGHRGGRSRAIRSPGGSGRQWGGSDRNRDFRQPSAPRSGSGPFSSGSVMATLSPPPGRLRKLRRPPKSTASWAMARPRPVPLAVVPGRGRSARPAVASRPRARRGRCPPRTVRRHCHPARARPP